MQLNKKMKFSKMDKQAIAVILVIIAMIINYQ